MFERVLRFLFALPVALAATAGLVSCASAPKRPAMPLVENSFIRGDKASPTAPQIEIAYDDAPKFPGFGGSGSERGDAQPLVRTPPRYPEHCMAAARQKETVLIEFDVTPEGVVENARVLDSTNSCLNEAAITSVLKWRYRPATDDADQPRWRRGVQTAITFELLEEPDPAEEPVITGENRDAPLCWPTKRPGFSRCPAQNNKNDWAVIEFDVSPDGYVLNPKVAESSGDRCFDYFAKNWIYSSICEPALDKDGNPRWYRGNRTRVSNTLDE